MDAKMSREESGSRGRSVGGRGERADIDIYAPLEVVGAMF